MSKHAAMMAGAVPHTKHFKGARDTCLVHLASYMLNAKVKVELAKTR
jgi:hypothetical protein